MAEELMVADTDLENTPIVAQNQAELMLVQLNKINEEVEKELAEKEKNQGIKVLIHGFGMRLENMLLNGMEFGKRRSIDW